MGSVAKRLSNEHLCELIKLDYLTLGIAPNLRNPVNEDVNKLVPSDQRNQSCSN